MMRKLAGSAAALCCLLLAFPAAASADYARVEDGVLRYTAVPGEIDYLSLGRRGQVYRLTQPHLINAERRAGPGCVEDAEPLAPGFECDVAGVTSIEISLDDRDDALNVRQIDVPIQYSGGAGGDSIAYAAGPIVLTNDGLADDGPTRRDNVWPDVERLEGSRESDVAGGGPNGTTIMLHGGDDQVVGGTGDSLVTAVKLGFGFPVPGNPNARFTLDPDGRDIIACGDGYDTVIADASDVVATDCEVVGRDGVTVRKQPGYEVRGSPAGEPILLPLVLQPNWPPTRVRAGGGDDTVVGGEEASGGSGRDRLFAVDGKRQSFRGDSGNDTIDARDQNPAKQVNDDSIRCGPGRDTAYADSADRVSKDCERVLKLP